MPITINESKIKLLINGYNCTEIIMKCHSVK